MRLQLSVFRSKVALRILVLFILCALVPIAILAVVSFTHVARQLTEQSEKRLHERSKSTALAIYERLLFLDATLKDAQSHLLDGRSGAGTPWENLEHRFHAVTFLNERGEQQPLTGRFLDLPLLTPEQLRHLDSGKTLATTQRVAVAAN